MRHVEPGPGVLLIRETSALILLGLGSPCVLVGLSEAGKGLRDASVLVRLRSTCVLVGWRSCVLLRLVEPSRSVGYACRLRNK
jgi:hypothetical protein